MLHVCGIYIHIMQQRMLWASSSDTLLVSAVPNWKSNGRDRRNQTVLTQEVAGLWWEDFKKPESDFAPFPDSDFSVHSALGLDGGVHSETQQNLPEPSAQVKCSHANSRNQVFNPQRTKHTHTHTHKKKNPKEKPGPLLARELSERKSWPSVRTWDWGGSPPPPARLGWLSSLLFSQGTCRRGGVGNIKAADTSGCLLGVPWRLDKGDVPRGPQIHRQATSASPSPSHYCGHMRSTPGQLRGQATELGTIYVDTLIIWAAGRGLSREKLEPPCGGDSGRGESLSERTVEEEGNGALFLPSSQAREKEEKEEAWSSLH